MSHTGVGDSLSPEARDAALHALATRAGGETVRYGESVQGRTLWAARFPSSAGAGAPKILCAANIHGVEFIGTRVAFGFADAVLQGGGAFGEVRQRAEMWLIPSINPDAYARTFESQGVGSVQELRCNANGVDLNRNFPLPLGATKSRLPFTGTDRAGDATYRGPAAFSEPETRHLHALMEAQQFHAVMSLHSFMGTVIPARVLTDGEFNAYGDLCNTFFKAQPRWKYRRMASRVLDAFTGELEDHAHHVHKSWAATLEVFPLMHSVRQHLRAPNTFWRFNPVDVNAYVTNDTPGMAAFYLAALQRPRPGI